MTRIIFICRGNICRSPMAEFVFKDMVEKLNISHKFSIVSAATSYEEIGNPVHPGTAKILDGLKIPYSGKRAVHLEKYDYENYDYLICMDSANVRNTLRIVGEGNKNKIYKLLTFAKLDKDVADPWFSGNFEATYNDILMGCKGLLNFIQCKEKIL